MRKEQLEALASSILIYLIIIISIFSVSLYSPIKPKSKTFTDKKSEVIEVSLGSPSHKKNYLNKKSKTKNSKHKNKKVEKKRKKPIKKVRNIQSKSIKKPLKKSKKHSKKPIKKSHKKIVKKVEKKSVNASSLFKNMPNNISDDKTQNKPVGNHGKSLKKVNKSKGIVNSYFAKVQNTLKGWPAQSNFAGEVVRVKLTIYPTGLFNYTIISRSLNPEFNRSLKEYLDQLKKFGFGAHSNSKPYNIVVEFIAK